MVAPATFNEPELRTPDGYDWLYVLSGSLRLILGDHDMAMKAAPRCTNGHE